MSFLNPTGVTTLWSRIMNYLTGSHVKTSVVSGATDVDGALTKLQTKTGTAALTTKAKNLSGAVNELNSGLNVQSAEIDNVEAAAAYVEDGDTASRTYTASQFILWKGLLYTVKTGGLPQGESISSTYLNPVTGGGFNVLNDKFNTLNSNFSVITVGSVTFSSGHATVNNALAKTSSKILAGRQRSEPSSLIITASCSTNGVLKFAAYDAEAKDVFGGTISDIIIMIDNR